MNKLNFINPCIWNHYNLEIVSPVFPLPIGEFFAVQKFAVKGIPRLF